MVIAGSLLLALSFLLYTSNKTGIIYAGTALLALGNGIMWPSLLALISKVADERVQGAVQGFAGSLAAVASIIGLLVGGLLYGFVGAWIFVLAASITIVVFLLSFAITTLGQRWALGVA